MFKIKPITGGITSRCRLTALLLIAVLAMAFSSTALAQHGAGVDIECFGPGRTCDTDADCPDPDFCSTSDCNLEILDTMVCNFTYDYNDNYVDDHQVIRAFLIIDNDSPNPPIVAPPSEEAEIVAVSGDTTCTVGGALPCLIGNEGGITGVVTFQASYSPVFGDTTPLPTQATVTVIDQCDDPAGQGSCSPDFENDVQFSSAANVITGCEGPFPIDCTEPDACEVGGCDPDDTNGDGDGCFLDPRECAEPNACEIAGCDPDDPDGDGCFLNPRECAEPNACEIGG